MNGDDVLRFEQEHCEELERAYSELPSPKPVYSDWVIEMCAQNEDLKHSYLREVREDLI